MIFNFLNCYVCNMFCVFCNYVLLVCYSICIYMIICLFLVYKVIKYCILWVNMWIGLIVE